MRAKQAEAADYRAFFADVYEDAVRFASRRTPTADRAEDAVAEAMLVAWRRFADAPADVGERRAWLFGIVRNTLLNANRSEARRSALAVRVGDSGGEMEAPDHADQVAQRLDLARAWRRLAVEQQEALSLAILENLSAAQAARVIGITVVAYRTRLSRARRALHAHMSSPRTSTAVRATQETTS